MHGGATGFARRIGHQRHRQRSPTRRHVDGAQVDLLLRDSLVARAITNATGRFAFAAVPAGRYVLYARRLGYLPRRVAIDAMPGAPPVDIVFRDYYEMSDSLDRAWAKRHKREVATARQRSRHWICEMTAREVDAFRDNAFRVIVGIDGADSRSFNEAHGIPRDRPAFDRSFQPIADAAECDRFARALDRRIGLVSDTVLVFRIGAVYWVPQVTTIFDRSGRVLVRLAQSQ